MDCIADKKTAKVKTKQTRYLAYKESLGIWVQRTHQNRTLLGKAGGHCLWFWRRKPLLTRGPRDASSDDSTTRLPRVCSWERNYEKWGGHWNSWSGWLVRQLFELNVWREALIHHIESFCCDTNLRSTLVQQFRETIALYSNVSPWRRLQFSQSEEAEDHQIIESPKEERENLRSGWGH